MTRGAPISRPAFALGYLDPVTELDALTEFPGTGLEVGTTGITIIRNGRRREMANGYQEPASRQLTCYRPPVPSEPRFTPESNPAAFQTTGPDAVKYGDD